ncbi:MAG: HlyD family efflux transporter periplasmic adaptor subunit [Lachnospiraceae bacterium]|nr:HlyD family efflux transporter periplasmic adaptor subunit [Lachnospiraceae bacterium]
MKKASFLKKHKKLFIFLIIVVALAGVFIYMRNKNSANANGEDDYTIGVAEKRTVVKSVAASGTIVAADSHEIRNTDLLGQKVLSVNVKVGDKVNEGDILVEIDTEVLNSQKETLNDQIASIQKSKYERHQDYNKLLERQEEERQKNIEDTEKALHSAEDAFTDAQTDYTRALNNYNDYLNNGGTERDAVAQTLYAIIASREAEVFSRQTNISTLTETLKTLTEGTGVAAGTLLDTYDDTTAEAIKALSDQILSIDRKIEECIMRSPSAGTVTEVKVKAGDIYTGGVVCMVEGEDIMEVKSYVDEYDIPDVREGMQAILKTDATRNDELPGTVTFVAPKPESSGTGGLDLSSLMEGAGVSSSMLSMMGGGSSSSATYRVMISLDQRSERLRLGMNVRVSIVTDRAENVMTVPYDAIQKDEDGNFFIEKVIESETKDQKVTFEKIPVKKGIEGTYYIEVIGEGITEGMQVKIIKTTSEESVEDLLNMMGSAGGI